MFLNIISLCSNYLNHKQLYLLISANKDLYNLFINRFKLVLQEAKTDILYNIITGKTDAVPYKIYRKCMKNIDHKQLRLLISTDKGLYDSFINGLKPPQEAKTDILCNIITGKVMKKDVPYKTYRKCMKDINYKDVFNKVSKSTVKLKHSGYSMFMVILFDRRYKNNPLITYDGEDWPTADSISKILLSIYRKNESYIREFTHKELSCIYHRLIKSAVFNRSVEYYEQHDRYFDDNMLDFEKAVENELGIQLYELFLDEEYYYS